MFLSKVQDSRDVITEGRIRVVFNIPCEPQLDPLIQNQHVSASDFLVKVQTMCQMYFAMVNVFKGCFHIIHLPFV